MKNLVVFAVIALVLLSGKKAKASETELVPGPTGGYDGAPVSPERIKAALQAVLSLYGKAKAKKLEQLYRWETAHFQSGQFRQTYTPGMWAVPGKPSFPYGWGSLFEFAEDNNLSPSQFSLVNMTENAGANADFIVFPSVMDAMLFVAYFLEKHNWNLGRWNSLDPLKQASYNEKVAGVVPRYVNEMN